MALARVFLSVGAVELRRLDPWFCWRRILACRHIHAECLRGDVERAEAPHGAFSAGGSSALASCPRKKDRTPVESSRSKWKSDTDPDTNASDFSDPWLGAVNQVERLREGDVLSGLAVRLRCSSLPRCPLPPPCKRIASGEFLPQSDPLPAGGLLELEGRGRGAPFCESLEKSSHLLLPRKAAGRASCPPSSAPGS